MKRYQNETVDVEIRPIEGEYLTARMQTGEDGRNVITVGRGENWTPLACKDVYGRAVKGAMAPFTALP